MDSIVHFENERFVGRTNFKSGLLNSLVILSVKDVEGVARMSHRTHKFWRFLNRPWQYGVNVDFDVDGVVIDVSIWMLFGYSAADVSYRVQETVLNVVSGIIDGKIKNVNVRINGVEQKTVA